MPLPKSMKKAVNKRYIMKAVLGTFPFYSGSPLVAKEGVASVAIEYPLKKASEQSIVDEFVRYQVPAIKFFNPDLYVTIRTNDDAEHCTVAAHGSDGAIVGSMAGSEIATASSLQKLIADEAASESRY